LPQRYLKSTLMKNEEDEECVDEKRETDCCRIE
jgi:hypothetical protein